MRTEIHIEDYNYHLPDDRIAKYPLQDRDSSKLLHYKEGKVASYIFRDLPSLLPDDAIMVFNDTKVVPARMHFRKESGALIEIFCLEPVQPSEYNLCFAATSSCTWKCVIGNAKRWKEGVLTNQDLHAQMLERDGQTATVRFSWDDGRPFSAVLDSLGTVPIPPYLNRQSEEIDKTRYQTLYARIRGSVAAPTAGLHFTQAVLDAIRDKGILMRNVCLHVGAGTFLPVKSSDIGEHRMHREPFVVHLDLLKELSAPGRPLVAVGTTSVRTLESLYYAGVHCIEEGAPRDIGQWEPYERTYSYSTKEALEALVAYLEREGRDCLELGTRIIIVPGFPFRLVDYLVTNFHQPESTLILLVSAFVDGDWQTIYRYALTHGFRFLSYGDSSLLERKSR